MVDFSRFWFARPSFLEGCARIFDFGNTLSEYNQLPTGAAADRQAIFSDWLAVGEDLRSAYLQDLAAQSPEIRIEIEKVLRKYLDKTRQDGVDHVQIERGQRKEKSTTGKRANAFVSK